jgi:protein CpxP
MTKNSRLRWVAGVAVAVLAVGTIAAGVSFGQQGPRGGGPTLQGGWMHGPGMGRGMMGGPGMGRGFATLRMGLGQLNLTDQQKEQIRTIAQGHREKVRGFAGQVREARIALREAVASGADEAAIRAKSAEIAKVEADLAVFGAGLRKEILGVLTPEQQAKAKELQQQALDRAEKMIQRRKKAVR